MTSNEKVYLSGHIDIPTDRWGAVMAELPKHVELTLAEPGCISFDVLPCPNTPNRLVVAESFEDQTAFESHQARTKTSEWFQATLGIERNFNITTGSSA